MTWDFVRGSTTDRTAPHYGIVKVEALTNNKHTKDAGRQTRGSPAIDTIATHRLFSTTTPLGHNLGQKARKGTYRYTLHVLRC